MVECLYLFIFLNLPTRRLVENVRRRFAIQDYFSLKLNLCVNLIECLASYVNLEKVETSGEYTQVTKDW